MKMIKKLLKDGAPEVLPDENIGKNLRERLFPAPPRAEETRPVGGGTAARLKKNILLAAGALVLAVGVALCFILPGLGRQPFTDGIGGNKFGDITTAEEFYAYGAASVGALLSSQDSAGATQSVAATRVAPSGTVQRFSEAYTKPSFAQTDGVSAIGEEELATVNRYMSLVEGLLSRSEIKGEAIQAGYGYEYGMSVTYGDLLGDSITYNMYYDRVLVGQETDGDESEQLYSIRGVLEVDGVSYPVEGRMSSESEEDESESELYFRAYTSGDARSYIEVCNESESEAEDGGESEQAYVYAIYLNGIKTESMRVEYETEDGETQLNMVITRGGITENLYFSERVGEDGRVISVQGDIGGERVRFLIYVRNGQYVYVFEDGSSSDFDRHGHGD